MAGILISDPGKKCNAYIPFSRPRAGHSGISGWPRRNKKMQMLGLWQTRLMSMEMINYLPQSLELDGATRWWLIVQVTFHPRRTARNSAQFSVSFWTRDQTLLLGEVPPKSKHTPDTTPAPTPTQDSQTGARLRTISALTKQK